MWLLPVAFNLVPGLASQVFFYRNVSLILKLSRVMPGTGSVTLIVLIISRTVASIPFPRMDNTLKLTSPFCPRYYLHVVAPHFLRQKLDYPQYGLPKASSMVGTVNIWEQQCLAHPNPRFGFSNNQTASEYVKSIQIESNMTAITVCSLHRWNIGFHD
jgi:hypothetical protein